MSPARILPGELHCQLPNLRRQARPSTPAYGLSPFPANERLMPTQKRSRSDQKGATRRAREMARRGCKQGSIRHPKFRPHDVSAQDLELVAQYQQFHVFNMQAPTATNKRPEQRPQKRGRETRTPCRRYSQPSPHEAATRILAPFRLAERQRARRARVSKQLPTAWKRLHTSGSRFG